MWVAESAPAGPALEGPSVWPRNGSAETERQPVPRLRERPSLKALARSAPRLPTRCPESGLGAHVQGRRLTCSKCSWATRRRGKWRKQSRALVKTTVTATPPPSAPARRSPPHITGGHRLPDCTLQRARAAGQAEGVRAGEDRSAPPPAATPLSLRSRTGMGKQAPPARRRRSASPLEGGTSFTEVTLAGSDARSCRFSNQSWHALTHLHLLLGEQESGETDVVVFAGAKPARWRRVVGNLEVFLITMPRGLYATRGPSIERGDGLVLSR